MRAGLRGGWGGDCARGDGAGAGLRHLDAEAGAGFGRRVACRPLRPQLRRAGGRARPRLLRHRPAGPGGSNARGARHRGALWRYAGIPHRRVRLVTGRGSGLGLCRWCQGVQWARPSLPPPLPPSLGSTSVRFSVRTPRSSRSRRREPDRGGGSAVSRDAGRREARPPQGTRFLLFLFVPSMYQCSRARKQRPSIPICFVCLRLPSAFLKPAYVPCPHDH